MTSSTRETELKACPFCGRDDELEISHIGAAEEWWWNVYCDHCCTHGPTAQTEAEAIATWNTRSPKDSELREALVEARTIVVIRGPAEAFPDLLAKIDRALSSLEGGLSYPHDAE